VVGDVVLLEDGDAILADCILESAENFEVDESSITGETYPA